MSALIRRGRFDRLARTPPGQTREKVYRFVRRRLLDGDPPTMRDVQASMGFRAVESARRHLDLLVEEGRLVKTAGRARGYRLPGAQKRRPRIRQVPLLGRVHAGDLHEALQFPEGYIAVEGRGRDADTFALTVQGESMKDIGILDGDTVIVRRQSSAENGDIVVALVGDEATVKRLRKRRSRVELHPENPAFAPIVPDPAELTILGKVIEVRRRLD